MSSRKKAPVTSKGRATRERIVVTSASLMYERGVAGTSMEDVMERVPASASQLYHYFSSKSELVRAVIEKQTELVVGGQWPLLTRLDSFDGIVAWRDAVVAVQLSNKCTRACPLGSLASELAQSDPIARADLVKAFAKWSGAIADGLTVMKSRGELAVEARPEKLANALLAAMEGGMLLSKTLRSVEPLHAALDVVIERIASLHVSSQRR